MNYLDGTILTFEQLMTGNTTYRKKKTQFKTPPLVTVVNDRLRLQSTIRELDFKFDVTLPSISFLSLASFLNKYSKWDEEKKKNFLIAVGGPANLKRMTAYMDAVIKRNQ